MYSTVINCTTRAPYSVNLVLKSPSRKFSSCLCFWVQRIDFHINPKIIASTKRAPEKETKLGQSRATTSPQKFEILKQ
jgi:hypothetical protein